MSKSSKQYIPFLLLLFSYLLYSRDRHLNTSSISDCITNYENSTKELLKLVGRGRKKK